MMLKYFIGILLIIIIILFSFRLIVYDHDFYYKNSYGSKEYIDNLIDYFKYDKELNTEYFNSKEILHLDDVKNLIDYFIYLFYFLLLTFILLMFKYYKESFAIFFTSFIFLLIITLIIYFVDFSSLF